MDQAKGTAPEAVFVVVIWKKCREALVTRPLFYTVVLLCLLLFAGMFYWPIKVTETGKMTDLQQVLFQLCIVALSVGLSWVFAKKSEETNILAKQKALANSAVRRISGILSSANRLNALIEGRKIAVKTSPEWKELEAVRALLIWEYFDGLNRQVIEMRDSIIASENDWRDILPEEFAKKEQLENEIRKAREVANEEWTKVVKELHAELEKNNLQGEARNAEQLAALTKTFNAQLEAVAERLSLRIQDIRSQLPPTLAPLPSSASPPVTANDIFYGLTSNPLGILPDWMKALSDSDALKTSAIATALSGIQTYKPSPDVIAALAGFNSRTGLKDVLALDENVKKKEPSDDAKK